MLSRKTLHVSLCVVPGDESFATFSTVFLFHLIIYFNVYRWVVPWSEFPYTKCTRLQVFSSMTLHLTLYVAPGDGSFVNQSTVMCIFPSVNHYVTHCVVYGLLCGVVCSCKNQIAFLWLGIIWLFITIFYVALPVTFLQNFQEI